ncbi:FUN14 domain-containing protein [Halalkalicoccus sp. NIPERK01]|uniref:FUN14 domain-containing protein n=1 Tax=Halalkalicoccus sp. NIPERK01 TaxID=3053469 RepID=UPI00256EE088|nr:FUN14 domain-containing protein [Halalkalicoccus sp. NIPERK01]MDL5360873.1 FUN14 domain-containing protein [Halalkalicoccus sp. NIPERK01]
MIAEAIDYHRLGAGFGGGGLFGAVCGFAAKQFAKALLLVFAAQLAVFRLLEARGILSVDWRLLASDVTGVAPDVSGWLVATLSTLSVGSGFVAGFLLGYRRG